MLNYELLVLLEVFVTRVGERFWIIENRCQWRSCWIGM